MLNRTYPSLTIRTLVLLIKPSQAIVYARGTPTRSKTLVHEPWIEIMATCNVCMYIAVTPYSFLSASYYILALDLQRYAIMPGPLY